AVCCGPPANAITATLAPPDRTPTVLGNCRPRLVGAWYTIVAVRAPAFRAPFARHARLQQLRLLREREHRQQRIAPMTTSTFITSPSLKLRRHRRHNNA